MKCSRASSWIRRRKYRAASAGLAGRAGGRSRPQPGDEAEPVNGGSAEGAGLAEAAAAGGERGRHEGAGTGIVERSGQVQDQLGRSCGSFDASQE
jgi:hypothetical protein